jgi:type II secretory pathway pseudopilin PulG
MVALLSMMFIIILAVFIIPNIVGMMKKSKNKEELNINKADAHDVNEAVDIVNETQDILSDAKAKVRTPDDNT